MKRERVALLVILTVAGVLRFTALDQGLRHEPHMDERYFVENASRMWSEGSLDHGFYEYPGLLFFFLAPVVGPVSGGEPPGPEAYLAARAFLAACGVLAVALAARLAAALAGPVAGLVAAAFLAVSPVHVETAHMLRPDVALEVLVLLVFLATLRVGPRLRNDALLGAAVGAAFGLKFSGVLAAVPYVVRRLLAPGPRVRGLLVAGAVTVVVFVAVSPYSAFDTTGFAEGVGTQLAYHYRDQGPMRPYADRLAGYLVVWPKAFGPIGVLLAVTGVVLARRRWREWLPFLILPPLTVALFATSGYRFDRHLIPSSSIVAALIGLTLAAIFGRWPRWAVALGIVALGFPLATSADYLWLISRPSTRDRAADWVLENVTPPARVLTTVPQLRVDSARYELLRVRPIDDPPGVLAREVAATIGRLRDDSLRAFVGLPEPMRLEPHGRFGGPRLLLRKLAVIAPASPLPLTGAKLTASSNPESIGAITDGRLDTFWSVEAERGVPEWIEVVFRGPKNLGRVELLLGDRPRDAGRGLEVRARVDGSWRVLEIVAARPPTREQLEALGFSEVLVFAEVVADALRVQRVAGRRRWSVAELRVSR